MTTSFVIQLITTLALTEGINPETALAIAKIESNYNMKATGAAGEIGTFQLMPQFSKYTKKQLRNPNINIKEGLRKLKEAKQNCVHQDDKTWILCYNLGIVGAKKIKHPKKFKYYIKFLEAREQIRKKNKFYVSK